MGKGTIEFLGHLVFSFLLARRKKASGLRTRFPLRVSVSLRPSLCSIGAVHSVRLSLLRKPGHGGTGLSVKEFDGYSVGCRGVPVGS